MKNINKQQFNPSIPVWVAGDYVGNASEWTMEVEYEELIFKDSYTKHLIPGPIINCELVFSDSKLLYDGNVHQTLLNFGADSKKATKITVGKPKEGFGEAMQWQSLGILEAKDPWVSVAEIKEKLDKIKPDSGTVHYFDTEGMTISYHHTFSGGSAVISGWSENNSKRPEVESLPGLDEIVVHPVFKNKDSLRRVVISLNDSHRWSREQIADWLETLDVDITFKVDTPD